MKNLGVLIFKSLFLCLAHLREVRQGISCSIRIFLIMIKSEVISREFFGLLDLTRAQTFCIYELTEVVVVSEYKDFIFAAFQGMAPSFKGFNNSQELFIVGFVPSLSKYHFL